MLTVDFAVFTWVNQALANPVLNKAMLWVTYLGTKTAGFLCILFLFLVTRNFISTLFALAGYGTNAGVFEAIKYLVGRDRPFIAHQVILRLPIEQAMRLNPSFPSGHTAIAFMIATLLSQQYGRYKLLFYTAACLVGFSRIYLGVHYPSDVIVGAIIGYGTTKTALTIRSRRMPKSDNG